MKVVRNAVAPVLAATALIAVSEFARNQVLLLRSWTSHYERLGLVFPADLVNGIVWGIWSLCFAITIYWISRRFSVLQTTLLGWFTGFVMMWLVIGNMAVLPFGILFFAVPLSLLEAFLATLIISKISPAGIHS